MVCANTETTGNNSDTITNHSASSHADIDDNITAVAYKSTEKENDSKKDAGDESGDSFTRIDSCNSGSEENNASTASGDDSADSDNSIYQRIKASQSLSAKSLDQIAVSISQISDKKMAMCVMSNARNECICICDSKFLSCFVVPAASTH